MTYGEHGCFPRGILGKFVLNESLEGYIVGGGNHKSAFFVSKMKEAANSAKWEEMRRLHGSTTEYGLEADVYLCSTLIHLYAKSGTVDDAYLVFEKMCSRDTIVWNAMMKAYSDHEYSQQVLNLFGQMQQEGFPPTKGTIVTVLKGCSLIENLDECRKFHVFTIWSGFSSDLHVQSSLIDMYGKCNGIHIACQNFLGMNECDEVVWNSMIAAFCQQGMSKESITVYEEMKQEGLCPNDISTLGMLKACSKGLLLKQGKYVHAQLALGERKSNLHVWNTLIDIYAKCHCLKEAREVFDHMSQKSVVSWNVMIIGYAQSGLDEDAMKIFTMMHKDGVEPDYITYATILKVCAGMQNLQYGKHLHELIVRRGLQSNTLVSNTLIEMYGKCNSIEDVLAVVNMIENKDIAIWNALLSVYSEQRYIDPVLDLFERMQHERIGLDSFTFVIMINVSAKMNKSTLGKVIHSHTVKIGFHSDDLILTSLVDMYTKNGNVEDAYHVFKNLTGRDVVSWTSMISGCFHHGMWKEACLLFEEMQCKCVQPDRVTFITLFKICGGFADLEWGKQIHLHAFRCGFQSDTCLMNTLIDMYVKCENIDLAFKAFKDMSKRNTISYNILMSGFIQEGYYKETIQLFEMMCQGCIETDTLSIIHALRACSELGSLDVGKQIHDQIQRQGFELNISLKNILIDVYAKCGSIDDARHIFDNMHERDRLSWNIMISGYARHGHGKKAIATLLKMKSVGLTPDAVSFNSILSACSYEGMIQEGCNILYVFSASYEASPSIEHYLCIVDMLGRTGCLTGVQEFIQIMPVQPNVIVWMTLLSICKRHLNEIMGWCAFASLNETEPEITAEHLQLKRNFAICGSYDMQL